MQNKLPMLREDVEKLRQNPNVQKATEWSVSFTPEFKKIAYKEYYSGKSMRQIFIDAGFNMEIIGDKRIQNFRYLLLKKANQTDNFKDNREYNKRKELKTTESQMAKRIRELEHRNAYLEQENDFLKKIQALEKECGGKVGKQK